MRRIDARIWLGASALATILASTAVAQEGDAESTGILRPQGLSDADERAFDDYERAFGDYTREAESFYGTVQELVTVEYRRERERRLSLYNTNIALLRAEERFKRSEAIANFETFLARFPNHPATTPDILFRLAELHFERSVDEFNQRDEDFQLALERYDMGIEPDPPTEPQKDFSESIRLFQRLLAEFPDYRQADGAYYLLAICHDQMDNVPLAFASFEQLVANHPESQFAQEAWLRLGEYHFDDARFELAYDAYQQALVYGDSRWYDKILFKLGWTTYLLSRFDEAITHFTGLLEWYEANQEFGGAALKEEATQYFAISLAEEDWDLDGERDPDFVMPRVDRYLGVERPYTIDVLDRLGRILMENQRYEYAIAVLQLVIRRYECDPNHIDRAILIVDAYAALRQLDEALAMQRELTTRFGPGSDWYACQERLGNTEAMAQAEQVVKDNLIETAARYYLQAQQTMNDAEDSGDPETLALAQQEFAFAARIYGDFLAAYEDDPIAYEMRLYHAQALLYGTLYEEAAEQFALIRDSLVSDEFMELAAALCIQSYELALESEIDAYRLEGRAWPPYDGANVWVADVEEEVGPDAPRLPPTEEPIPELSLSWVAAVQRYLDLGLMNEDEPGLPVRYTYQLAKLHYDYKHYTVARAQFESVLAACDPTVPESGFAAGFLINIFRATELDVRALLEDFQGGRYSRCVPSAMLADIVSDVTRVSLGQRAERAEAFFAEGKFEEAALEYARLADEYADDPEFAPLGLWNSGLIYEQQLRRYERAIAQFDRLIAVYPQSEFVDSAYVRIAVNAKRFFDFERAIETFMVLHRKGFSDPELIEHPILDAAELLRSVGRGAEAAEAYLEFARAHPNDSRAAAAVYSAAMLYDEQGDHRAMRRTLDDFRSRYGNASSDVIDVDAAIIDGYFRSARAYESAGDTRNAVREYDRLLGEYSLRLPDAIEAKYAAAKVIYDRALGSFATWDSIRLGDSVTEQQRGLAQRRDGLEALIMEFRTVVDYGSADWTVCAFYMEGRVFQVMADLLYRLPVPDFRGDIDAEDEYVLMVEDFAAQYEDQAIQSWEVAYPLMRELGVTNQCTIDMTAQLNRYRGSQYPVFRNAAVHQENEVFSPSMVSAPTRPEVSTASPTTAGADGDE